jgi:Ras-related protein Rab-7A
MSDKFTNQYRATVGADFLSKDITFGNKTYNLQVWDTAGQERFQSIGSAFYRGADACVIVYDITSLKSFEAIEGWKQEFIMQGGIKDADKFPFIIIGNKSDKESDRKVEKARVENWCQNNGGLSNFETSAKDNVGVSEAFEKVTSSASEMIKEEEIYVPPTVKLGKKNVQNSNKTTKEGCNC